ncbi:hypothetical protein [Pedobacter boryungensis]|uniref:Uncharacterized protein n=1 Tax=Pedobacter boryungensis TaxID=869962 RepID=A0ABX2DEQ2_9SPHI|nr:hypothetical protein [Pedobacter boryungensis]NQX32430.1 hypothetical protein [Pedobacter boryungensis]
MITYKRTKILDKYFAIDIFECPIAIIQFAATLGAKHVTIENYRHYRNPNSLKILMKNNDGIIEPKLKQFLADFQISNADFISLLNIWDTQGCYAIFHEGDSIKFKATDLNEFSRYKALDNFKWTLEMAIPDSASDGWGQLVSPNVDIIDKIENYIQALS